MLEATEAEIAWAKKLLYRSRQRGTREADLIMHAFAQHFLPSARASRLANFEEALELPEPRLLPWILGYDHAHPDPGNPVLDQIKAFFEETCTTVQQDGAPDRI